MSLLLSMLWSNFDRASKQTVVVMNSNVLHLFCWNVRDFIVIIWLSLLDYMFDCINDGINGTNGINIINLNKYHNSNLTSIGFNNCLYLYVMNISKLHILIVSTIIAYYFSIIPSSRPKYQILCVVITIICMRLLSHNCKIYWCCWVCK